MDLQRRKNKKDGEVDLDDKVGELSSKHLGDQAGGDIVIIIPKIVFSQLLHLITRRSRVGM